MQGDRAGHEDRATLLGRLNPHQQLLILTGLVCHEDVELESVLGGLFLMLSENAVDRQASEAEQFKLWMAAYDTLPRDFIDRQKACKRLIREHPDYTDDQKRVVLRALGDAKAAHNERTRVVHDAWIGVDYGLETGMPVWERVQHFGGLRTETVRVTQADVESVLDRLFRCRIRLYYAPFGIVHRHDAVGRDDTWAMVRGEFDVMLDGEVVPHAR